MRARQIMQAFDWFQWAALVAIGLFVGLTLDSMFTLAAMGGWISILTTLIMAACGIVFYLFVERMLNFISTGRWSMPRQLQKPRKPLLLLFALPLGILLGVFGAQFGLRELLL